MNPPAPISGFKSGNSVSGSPLVSSPVVDANSPSGTAGNPGSSVSSNAPSGKNDLMLIDFPELDSPFSSNTVHNTFDENAVQVLKRIGNCNARLAALFDPEDSIMDLETTTMEEFNLREAKVRSLKHYITYWKNQLVSSNLLYNSFKETSVSHISHLANVMKLDDSDKALTKPKDHSDIPAKKIPVFDVKYTDLDIVVFGYDSLKNK
ncbi:hypothetical protein INT47_006070 [Mucor saturninus]|uniref:Uncharacterized protein n=1 Tax=Mucor saturninus TaxID=64648 RepID=A0A8H7QGE1_9FUNG|nr:hypothetical protein INT47_006070 [Mucor saturninus]